MEQEKIRTPDTQNKKRKLRNDLILITALLTVLILIGLAVCFCRGKGDLVVVEVNGKTWGTYTLSENRVVEIYTGEDGSELNRLVIQDGKAYVQTATCPDGICANHKPVFRQGESIVCLPHKVVITVRRSNGTAPDVVIGGAA